MRTSIIPRLAGAVLTLALAGAFAAAAPAAAEDSDYTRGPEALERVEAKAKQLAERRLSELVAQGLPSGTAQRVVDAEQVQAAAETRERLLELLSEGMTVHEVAEITPGMVVVSAPSEEGNAPLSSPSDVSLTQPSMIFTPQCNCFTVQGNWEWDIGEQETGNDGAGLRVTRQTFNLGGSALVCDLVTGCDAVGGVTWEEPAGVVHRFSTRSGDHGLISFSFRKINSGCHQAYFHYAHAWQGDYTLTSVSIGTGGVSFTFEQPGNKWSKQRAGGGSGC